MRRLGLHVRSGQGLAAAARQAHEAGCTTFQIMSGNPSAWNPGRLDPVQALEFSTLLDALDLRPVFLHAGYLINLACRTGRSAPIYAKSLKLLQDNIDRAAVLTCEYVIMHLGSCLQTPRPESIETIAGALERLKPPRTAPGRPAERAAPQQAAPSRPLTLLLENSAGSGGTMGATFEELAAVLQKAATNCALPLGICLDTAHMWGAGYDISTEVSAERTISDFDRIVGLQHLHCIHFNDSAAALGSRRDRHEHIGCGMIAVAGLGRLARDPRLTRVPLIMETPGRTEPTDSRRMQDLRELAGEA